MIQTRVVGVLVLGTLLLSGAAVFADRIHLKNGQEFDVDAWREDGADIVYQRFGGEVRVPRDDVLRIDPSDPVDTTTQAPRGPSSSAATAQPPGSRVTPLGRPVERSREPDSEDRVAVVHLRYQLLEASPAGSRLAWELTVENFTDEPRSVEVSFLLGDDRGTNLYASPLQPVDLRPRQRRVLSGTALIAGDVSTRFLGSGYLLRGR